MKRFIFIFLFVLLLGGCSDNRAEVYSKTVPMMGTFVQVKVSAPFNLHNEIAKAVNEVFGYAHVLEDKFNPFDPFSEVNVLNVNGSKKASPVLFDLIKLSTEMSSATEGKFDITVAPLLKEKGFYSYMPKELLDMVPTDIKTIGWRNIVFGTDNETIILHNGTWLDLSGIAKGYIVDLMSAFLKDKGISRFMINAGGDIYCSAKNDEPKWSIGVRKPGGDSVLMVLDLGNMAVATSGDYENVHIDDMSGESLSHIADTESCKLLPEKPSSVSVIALTCAEADALATAMMAMEMDMAIALADSMDDIEIIVVDTLNGKETIKFSAGAEKFITKR